MKELIFVGAGGFIGSIARFLVQNGQFLTVLLYTGLSILLGFLAAYIGLVVSNLW